MGALSGVASHLKGAGEGALLGGIPGAIAGGVNPKLAQENFDAARQVQRNAVQQSNYQAQNAQEQAAMNHVRQLELEREYSMAPKSVQDELDQSHEKLLADNYHLLVDNGNGSVVQTFGPWNDPDSYKAAQTLQGSYMKYGVQQPFNYQLAVNPSGNLTLVKVRDMNVGIPDDVKVDTGEKDANGQPVAVTVPAGTPFGKLYDIQLQNEIARVASVRKVHEANATGVTAKNEATANKSNAQATNAVTSNGEWRPKVSADEKKKAELAENIAFNANEVSRILLKRPDIVGAIAGRFTNTEQMIGNNDPDISAIGTHVHNLAMANSGVHGFRSQEGVKSYENQILNNFKNGPRAIAGALRASVGSVQTFIDNARPDTYKTHSKQGGAARAMQGGQ
jgi:hypothetical protein